MACFQERQRRVELRLHCARRNTPPDHDNLGISWIIFTLTKFTFNYRIRPFGIIIELRISFIKCIWMQGWLQYAGVQQE